MAVNFGEAMSNEVAELKTSIKYHDWFLGFVVVVGISLTVYLVDSMNALNDGLHGVRLEVREIRQELQAVHLKIDSLERKVDGLERKVDGLERKMDEYHGRGNDPNL